MSEQEFQEQCERILRGIEDALDARGADVESSRMDKVLELEFDDGSKIIVNGNAPVREVWIAARSGGFHFRHVDGQWLDTRSGNELFTFLSELVSQQTGEAIVLAPAA